MTEPVVLGTEAAERPALVTDHTGRVGAFVARTEAGTLHAAWREADGNWGKFEDLGMPIGATAPVPARAPDGRIGVFYHGPGSDGVAYLRQNETFTGWTAPEKSGALLFSDPAVGAHENGRLEVFFIGDDRALWHQGTTSRGPDGFGKPELFGGGNADGISVTLDSAGRLAFFHVNTSNVLWLMRQNSPNGSWGGFSRVFDGVWNFASARGTAGVSVVYLDGEGHVFVRTEQVDGTWSAPRDISVPGGYAITGPTPTLLAGADGRLHALWKDNNGIALAHQSTPGSDTWTTTVLPETRDVLRSPAALFGPGDQLSVLYTARDSSVRYLTV